MQSQLRLRQLQALAAVAEEGTMTRAAQRLGISQPAVSRLLADLAAELGFAVLERREGRVSPTQEARFLLPDIRRLLEILDQIANLGQDITERRAGHLRVACLPGFATSHLPEQVARFLATRSGVTLTIEPDRPERILEWMIGEQCDVGITDGFEGHPAIESEAVAIRMVCVFAPDHPLAAKEVVTPADLRDERIIHTRRDSQVFKDLSEAFHAQSVPLNSVVEVRQFTAACELAALGLGVSVVSALDAESFRARPLAWRPFRPAMAHRLALVRPVHKQPSMIAMEFLDQFRDSLRPFLA